jgi:mannose/fructose/N-acetylgalactosamine-specific phosphotransferase system component IIC
VTLGGWLLALGFGLVAWLAIAWLAAAIVGLAP